ncbi:MAG TPA: hypothetical protein PKA90_13480 [Ignavibacteria bacterium]|nr:hypothetical protein [Ignavibacteria bacterium]HMR41431.1 hypothetical protein [Ignavibacteria bacterium]
MKIAEKYLSYLKWDHLCLNKSINILEQYYHRRLNDLFDRKLNQFEKNKKSTFEADDEYYNLMHRLEELKYNNLIRDGRPHLALKSNLNSQYFLLCFFLIKICDDYQNINVHKMSFDEKIPVTVSENFFNNFNFKSFLKNATGFSNEQMDFLYIHYYENKLVDETTNISNYYKLRDLILKCSKFIGKNLLYIYFSRLNGFCIINTSTGQMNMDRELFDNFKLMLDRNLFIREDHKILGILEYRSILHVALRLKEFNWTEHFINDYKNSVTPDKKQNVYKYGLANLLFEKKNYLQCLEILSKIEPDYFIIKNDIHILLAKIYYELNYYDSALSLIDSSKHFINYNKVFSSKVKLTFTSFFKYYTQLLKLKIKHSNFKTQKLKEQISFDKSMINKSWLLEKIKELSH